jgi:hypothetical protein
MTILTPPPTLFGYLRPSDVGGVQLFRLMFTDFLTKTISRTLKIILSYLSWQSHEKLLNPTFSTFLTVALFIFVISLAL